jgi:hypothetical protein
MAPGFDGGAGPYARTPKSLEAKAGDACGPRARPQHCMPDAPIVASRAWIEVGHTTRAELTVVCKVSSSTVVCINAGATESFFPFRVSFRSFREQNVRGSLFFRYFRVPRPKNCRLQAVEETAEDEHDREALPEVPVAYVMCHGRGRAMLLKHFIICVIAAVGPCGWSVYDMRLPAMHPVDRSLFVVVITLHCVHEAGRSRCVRLHPVNRPVAGC